MTEPRRQPSRGDLRAEGAENERVAVVTYLHNRALALESDARRRPSDDQRMHARRLRALADDLRSGLHVGDAA